jgi:hypothetical protein
MRDENYNSKQPFIAASADPTPELLLASFNMCIVGKFNERPAG